MLAEVVVKLKEIKKDHPFTYLVPKELEKEIGIGSLVEIPLGRRKTTGVVVDLAVRRHTIVLV